MYSIAIGCDCNADEMKNQLIDFLKGLGYTSITDYGSSKLYPEIALRLASAVACGRHDRGILLCGTGIGMCVAANKVPGVYAAVLENAYSAERAQLSNCANIATFGFQTIGIENAKKLLKIWLDVHYTPGERSEPKISLIREYEKAVYKQG
jgi:ribose 5-phosphate isomerase B